MPQRPSSRTVRRTRRAAGRLVCALALAGAAAACSSPVAQSDASTPSTTTAVRRGAFVRRVRLAGTIEATRTTAVLAPRMAGQSMAPLVITRLAGGGTRVRAGDVLVEFDRQDQIRNAQDRRAEFQDLEAQLRQKGAEQAAALAQQETALKTAESDVGRARLQVQTNALLPRLEAEKNDLALEEAEARVKQLTETLALRRRAADAERRILEIRRDRARRAMEHAEGNASRMTVMAPFDGLVVVRTSFRGSQMLEIQEGDEVRPGMAVLNLVDPTAMRVRARASQADAGLLAAGQPARVVLDAYPDLAFDGRVGPIAPLATLSSLTPMVRTFAVAIDVDGSHPSLMPDLSAAVDVEVERRENLLIVPRDAVVLEGDRAWVLVARGGSFARQAVTVAAASAGEAAIASGPGLDEGDVVARRAAAGGR